MCKSTGAPWPSFTDPGWLAAWGDPAAVLAGSGIHSGEIAAVRDHLASNRRLGWTPAGVRGVNRVLYFGATFPDPTGDWDAWANRDTDYRYVPLNADAA